MNINSSTYRTSYLRSQQHGNQKTPGRKTFIEGQGQIQASKSVEITATIHSVEKTEKYDLENITPKETHTLAKKFLKEDLISFSSFLSMMVIGIKHALPPGQINVKPNNEPFNLLKEVEARTSWTHSTSKEDINDTKKLLEFLYGYQSDSINITA